MNLLKKVLKTLGILLILFVVVIYLIPVSEVSFIKLYDGDPAIAEQLTVFRAKPLKSLVHKDIEWNYFDSGGDKEPILFLHGMGGAYDIWFQQMDVLQSDFRVISVTYPAVNSLDELAGGILDILDREQIEKVNVIGTSLGGYLTQFLMARYPERLNKVIIGNSFPPNKFFKQQNSGKGKALPLLPEWLIMKLFKGNVIQNVVPASDNSSLVKAYLLEQASGLMSKKQFIGRFNCVIQEYVPADTDKIKNDILIIESDNDPLVPKVLRDSLKLTYPNAKVYTFHNTGHFTYLNQPVAYTNVIAEFFKNEKMMKDEIKKRIKNYYFKGRKEGNVELLDAAFAPGAQLVTVEDGKLVNSSLSEYLDMVKQKGSVDCVTSVLNIYLQGDIAIVETSFDYGPVVYNDFLSLARIEGDWKIIYKLYTKVEQ